MCSFFRLFFSVSWIMRFSANRWISYLLYSKLYMQTLNKMNKIDIYAIYVHFYLWCRNFRLLMQPVFLALFLDAQMLTF